MNKITKQITALSLALVTFVGLEACHKDDAEPNITNQQPIVAEDEVVFQSEISKVSGSQFETRDTIAVFAYDDDKVYRENVAYAYNNNLFTSSAPIRHKEENQALSYRAVYPYTEIDSTGNFTFTVATNQSLEGNYSISDLMSSYCEKTQSTMPTLHFKHLLSRVVVKIVETDIATKEASAVLGNMYTTVNYNLFTHHYYTKADSTSITMAFDNDSCFTAVVVPQMINTSANWRINIGAKSFYIPLNIPSYEYTKQYAAGLQYIYEVAINGDDIKLVESYINGWYEGDTTGDLDGTISNFDIDDSKAVYQVWDGTTEEFSTGDGTADSPFIIATPSQLAHLYTSKFFGTDTYYKVADNSYFDMSGYEWTPIYNFKGFFDGNNVVIKGLNIECDYSNRYTGLFGSGSVCEISGVNFLNGSITGSSLYAAAIIGYAASSCKIKDCKVQNSTITVNYGNSVAAIAASGISNILIENCHVSGTTIDSNSSSTAGIISSVKGTNNIILASSIRNSTIKGDDSSGITNECGNISEYNNYIAGCYVAKDVVIKSTSNNRRFIPSGIISKNYGYVSGCYSMAYNISGISHSASLVGLFTEVLDDDMTTYLLGTEFMQECYTTTTNLPIISSFERTTKFNSRYETIELNYPKPTHNLSGNAIVVNAITQKEASAMNSAIKSTTQQLGLNYTYKYVTGEGNTTFPYTIKRVDL